MKRPLVSEHFPLWIHTICGQLLLSLHSQLYVDKVEVLTSPTSLYVPYVDDGVKYIWVLGVKVRFIVNEVRRVGAHLYNR